MAAALRLAAKRICGGALQRPPQAFLTATKELAAPRTSHGYGGSSLRQPFSSSINPLNIKAAGSSSTGNGKSGTLWKKQLWLVAKLASPVILLMHLGSLIRRDNAEKRRRIEIERHLRRSFEDYDYFISTKDKKI